MGQLAVVDQFKNEITAQSSLLAEVLPQHLPVDRFIRAAVIAVTGNPSLLDADRQSLFDSLQKCAIDGLVPDNKEAALIEFNTKVKVNGKDQRIKKIQYLPMIDGVLKRARQSGVVATITARAVHRNDAFDYWVDENGEHLNHRPDFMTDRGEMVLVYAVAKLTSGEVIVEPMSMADIHKVMSASRSKGEYGPWKDWFDRMSLKSVLHRLARRLPNSSEIMEMLDRGSFLYDFDNKDKESSPGRPAIEHYPQESFEENFPKWEAAIKSGKRTPNDIITVVSSKAELTEEQKKLITGVAA